MINLLSTRINHFNFKKNNIAFDTPYQYALLTPEFIDQVVDVFTQAFCRAEPMTAYLQMDEAKYRDFAHAVVTKAVADQMSVVALDQHQVIACAINEDIADPGAIPDFDPKFKYILALLESLGETFFYGKKFAKNEMAHLFITAVAEQYRHQGISTQVNFHAMDLARAQGFKTIYCEFTHHFNEYGVIHHLSNKKRLIGQIVYEDFIYGHERPFAYLAGGAHSFLWDIHGENKLQYEKDNQEKIEMIEQESINAS